jgi:Uma2 family endonuclease
MLLLPELSELLQAEDPEERQTITGVNWNNYEALINDLGDSLQYRVTYLDGVIELISPSRRHEIRKTIIVLDLFWKFTFKKNASAIFPLVLPPSVNKQKEEE